MHDNDDERHRTIPREVPNLWKRSAFQDIDDINLQVARINDIGP